MATDRQRLLQRRLVVGLVVFTFFGGVLVVVLTGFYAEADCRADESKHPNTGRCVSQSEVCTLGLEATGNRTTSCEALSKDGHAFLEFRLAGTGVVHIRAIDASGNTTFDRWYAFPYVERSEVRGTAGTWRLDVEFHQAEGDARLTLWG